jgi:hypothetical protein
MDRRSFMLAAARAGAGMLVSRHRPWRAARELAADVVIVGGGLGGCAAALAALEAGRTVIMTEPTPWVGGQLTSQAVPPDEHPWIEQFGCNASYRRLRDGIREYYRRHYPLTRAAFDNPRLDPGNAGVSPIAHEPRVALAVLNAMLAPHASAGRLTVLHEHAPDAAEVDGDRVRAVTLLDRAGGGKRTLSGSYFLDATELGDLLPLAGAEFVTGFEPSGETGEPSGPAEAQPLNQQAFTYCFAMDYREGEDHTIERPRAYEFWRGHMPALDPGWPGPLLSWTATHPVTRAPRTHEFDPRGAGKGLWVYRRLADPTNFAAGQYASGITLVNWPQNDYMLGPLVGVSPEEGEEHRARAKQLSLSLLYWMQTEAPRADGGVGWKGLRLRADVVGTRDGIAMAPYIRESRRIRAERTVVEEHVSTNARREALGREDVWAERFADSVGIGSYRIDLHPSSGGDNYIDVSSLPFQIPLGALIPIRLENLLPACKNLGVTHITNGCFRLHPVEWAVGEAAGALAAHCVESGLTPRGVRNDGKRLADFQAKLRRGGVELEWPRLSPR